MADKEIDVKIKASDAGASSSIDAVKDKIASLSDPVDSVSASLEGLAEKLAAAFAADKIIDFTESVADAALQLEKLENLSGLSSDTIQTLQFAMQRTGGDAEAAGQMLTRFGRNISEAANGSGPAFDAFQKLGIGIDDLRHKSEQELFDKTVDGFKNIEDTSTRAQVGVALFSRGFLNIAGVLSEGGQWLEYFRNKMMETGDYMNEVRQNKFKNLDEAIKDLKSSWHGLTENLLSEVAPALTSLLNFFTGLIEKMAEFNKSVILTANSLKVLLGLETQEQYNQNVDAALNLKDKDKPKAASDPNRGADAKAQKAKDAAQKQLELDRQVQEDKVEMYSVDYSNFSANQALMVAKHEETKTQELQADLSALESERDLTQTALLAEIDTYEKGTAAYQKAVDAKIISEERFNAQITQMRAQIEIAQEQEAQKSAKKWTDAINTIDKSFDTMLTGILQGTQTIGQAFTRMGQNMALSFTLAIAQILAKNALLVISQEAGFTQISAALTKNLGEWVITETKKTAATDAGAAARAAVVSADLAEEDAANEASASAQIMQDAAKAASGAYSAIAGIPYVGPILAPIAAGVAFAAVAAFDSFDVGTPYVPQTGLAMIHEGEKIVPKNVAKKWDDGELNKLGGGGGVHLHVHALDHQDVKRYLNRNSSMIAKAVGGSIRNGNRSFAR